MVSQLSLAKRKTKIPGFPLFIVKLSVDVRPKTCQRIKKKSKLSADKFLLITHTGEKLFPLIRQEI